MQVLIFISLFVALYCMLLDTFKIYKIDFKNINIFKTNKYMIKENKQAKKLSNFIKLPSFLREDLLYKIDMLNLKTTPEVYVSNVFIDNIIYLLIAIIMYFIEPIMTIIFIFVFLFMIFKSYNQINKDLRKKREEIESEIPRFLSYVLQNYKTSKDIKPALEIYQKTANNYFKQEIDITLADMITGSRIESLMRLDQRVNSYEFSRVIKAIITVIRGDENIDYIKMLYKEFQVKEVENLKKIAILKPKKVEKYIIGLTILVVIMYMYIVIVKIIKDMQILFSY